jgi:signal transduction histidine kinase
MFHRAREFFGQKFAASGAIDYPIYSLLAVSVVLTSVLTWADFVEPERTIAIVLANLFAVAVLFVIILALGWAWKSRGSELTFSLGFLVLVGAALGGVKGFLTWLGMELLGQGDVISLELWGRVIFSAVTGLIVVPSVALFGSLRYRYSKQREELITEKVASVRGDSYPETLARFITDAKNRIKSPELSTERGALVTELRDIVNSDLRPLSQKIWTQESERFPSFRLGQIAKVAIFRHVYSISWVVPLWAITTVAGTLRVFSAEEGIWIQLVRSVLLALGLWLATRIIVGGFAGALVVYTSSISVIAVLQVVMGTWLATDREFGEDLGFTIANVIWLFQLTMFVGMGKVFIEMAKQVESEYEKFLSDQDLEEIRSYRQLALKDRQLAQFLHGHVQTKLNGVASRIESREAAGDVRADLDEIEVVLNQALGEFGSRQAQNLPEVVESLQRDWGGLVKLTFAVSPIELEDDQFETIREIISEGIANAVRHGFSSEVSIMITAGPEIVVLDNGTGPRDGKAGLGTTYFSSVATTWSLTATEAGAKLTVNLS